LLFGVTEAVERSGTALALPSQRTYVSGRSTRSDRESSRSPARLR
jgi:hypothetical protein